MIASAWGIMAGISAMLTLIAVLASLLGCGYNGVLTTCAVAAGLGLSVTLPTIKNEYFHPKAKTAGAVLRLFLTAALFGFVSPFTLLYTSCRMLGLKYWLIFRIHKHNRTLEEIRIKLREAGITLQETRVLLRQMSRTHRGSPFVAMHQLKNENLRRRVIELDERREDLLDQCHRLAGELGTKLKVYDKGDIQPSISIIHLIYVRIETAYIPVNSIILRHRT